MLTARLLALPRGLDVARRWLLAACRCVRSDRAFAATEFALLAPLMIMIYVGAGELSQAAMTSRRTAQLSRTLVDLLSQQPTSSQTSSTPTPSNATSQTSLQSILAAATAVLAPSPLATLTMTVSAIDISNNSSNQCCTYKVRWSYTQAGTLRPCAVSLTVVPATQAPSPTTISAALVPPVASLPNPVAVLVADVSYSYAAPFASTWLSFPAMKRTTYMLPRYVGQVVIAPVQSSGNQSGTICY